MSIQFILFMGIDAGVTLLLMRQEGMWRRLRAAPLSRAVLLGSRVAGTTLISMLILAVVYLAACLIFGVRIAGSFPGLVMVAIAFSLPPRPPPCTTHAPPTPRAYSPPTDHPYFAPCLRTK